MHIEEILGVAILGLAVIWATGHKKRSPMMFEYGHGRAQMFKVFGNVTSCSKGGLIKRKVQREKKRSKISRCQNDRILYILLVLINNLARSARIT